MPERQLKLRQNQHRTIQVMFEFRSTTIQSSSGLRAVLFLRTMPVHAFPETREPVGAVDGAARHLRVWLAASGLSYDATARDSFVRAHAVLFGRACDVTLRGYDRWRWRHRLHDTPAAFARYMAPRHQRWMSAQHESSAMAPCLTGAGSSLPCWAISGRESDAAQSELRSAA